MPTIEEAKAWYNEVLALFQRDQTYQREALEVFAGLALIVLIIVGLARILQKMNGIYFIPILSVVLVGMLFVTGLMLKFAYQPVPDQAYASIVNLQNTVLFGRLIRNFHHWSGNALLLQNPHLPWSGLFLFYEAHIALPDANVYGATLVGFPVLGVVDEDRAIVGQPFAEAVSRWGTGIVVILVGKGNTEVRSDVAAGVGGNVEVGFGVNFIENSSNLPGRAHRNRAFIDDDRITLEIRGDFF